MFNSLKIAKQLKASGFNEPQTEALINVLEEVQESSLDRLATKDDIRELKDNDIRELKDNIKNLKNDINFLKWILGLLVTANISIIIKLYFS